VADPVDAGVLLQEGTAAQAVTDCTESDTSGNELGPRHNAMRPARDPADLAIRGRLVLHHDTNRPRLRNPPP
jgi:hypothetical protein